MSNDLFAFVGTYTRLGSEGIYTLRMHGDTGDLEQVSVATGIENPSFLALDPSNMKTEIAQWHWRTGYEG